MVTLLPALFQMFSQKRSTSSQGKEMEILKQLECSDESLRNVMALLEENMNRGLGKATNHSAIVKMFPSYVRSVPDGSEFGRYLALDLGGTNFRVLLITLDKDKKPDILSEIYFVPEEIMTGPGVELFDHIADCIWKFLECHKIHQEKDTPIPLGFTFSFPCKQKGLNVGILEMWTKGFNCSGVEGMNVVELLEAAIARKEGLYVKCVAILNDTVGTLMSCAYEDRQCLIGLILGTGTNACYMENLDRVELWDEDLNEPKQVIINTEWGAFGSDGCLDFIRTEFDEVVDESSINPQKQIYEKMISGMYLGELVRLVLIKLANQNLLFGGHVSDQLMSEHSFLTKFVSEVESDSEGSWSNTQRVLTDLGLSVSSDDCLLVHIVCRVLSTRAAHLAAAGVATLLNRMSHADVSVGVDGSLYKYHPKFRDVMQRKLEQLVNTGLKFKLLESHDGSGKGAALVAAVANKLS